MLRPLAALAALATLAALLLVAGCDGTDREAQFAFETDALLSPVDGFTRTDADGSVGRRDAADWRIGPAYLNNVEFVSLPSPNPVALGQAIRFATITRAGVTGGLRAYRLADDRTGGADLVPIFDAGSACPDAAGADVCQFTLSASQIAPGGPGLYRILLLDGGQGVVSYGDVSVTE